MSFFANTVSGLGAALLPLASVLLLEELTYGGLVRLLLRPRPVPRNSSNSESRIQMIRSKQVKPYYREGEGKCSR